MKKNSKGMYLFLLLREIYPISSFLIFFFPFCTNKESLSITYLSRKDGSSTELNKGAEEAVIINFFS